ncbi:hypothetical protein [Agromyces larvae]|uniref:Uncharacterized protein n=1 Tax=Agromyces larvae TaxID=2929802 RepID=A0ABY4C6H9_9MICO|nr:hypothetical protein [Agromyces larvae]UOE44320.1 hypothetical protein MTO99_00555 [Agromyces larvae]
MRTLHNIGNHVFAVANAVRLAERLGAGTVVLPQDSIFNPGSVGAIELTKARVPDGATGIFGSFFYFDSLGFTRTTLERARVLLALRDRLPEQQQSEDFVLHLRAGDVFRPRPHPRYAPPPLDYYLAAIEKTAPARVVAVTQSHDHPYLRVISLHCRSQGIDFLEVNGSAEADFHRLRSARTLCVSQGTFAVSAAWLSKNCDSLLQFDQGPLPPYTTFYPEISQQLGIHVALATATGHPREWHGTAAELVELMSRRNRIDWTSYGPD